MPNSLKACHENLGKLIGSVMEPIAVIRRAEEHRWYWRSATPRVVLLAESHVYTSNDELLRTIRPSPALPSDLPRGFVRLVYCLGYGEDQILEGGPVSPGRNGGTPQFWKVFMSCLAPMARNQDFAAVQALTPFRERIKNKLSILEKLKAAGIWLVDASIAALYLPGRPKPAPQLIEQVLRASWDGYIRSVIAEAAPEAILCIGRVVERSLHSRLTSLGKPWAAVPQPNARLSSAEHFRIFGIYRSVCADAGYITRIQ